MRLQGQSGLVWSGQLRGRHVCDLSGHLHEVEHPADDGELNNDPASSAAPNKNPQRTIGCGFASDDIGDEKFRLHPGFDWNRLLAGRAHGVTPCYTSGNYVHRCMTVCHSSARWNTPDTGSQGIAGFRCGAGIDSFQTALRYRLQQNACAALHRIHSAETVTTAAAQIQIMSLPRCGGVSVGQRAARLSERQPAALLRVAKANFDIPSKAAGARISFSSNFRSLNATRLRKRAAPRPGQDVDSVNEWGRSSCCQYQSSVSTKPERSNAVSCRALQQSAVQFSVRSARSYGRLKQPKGLQPMLAALFEPPPIKSQVSIRLPIERCSSSSTKSSNDRTA